MFCEERRLNTKAPTSDMYVPGMINLPYLVFTYCTFSCPLRSGFHAALFGLYKKYAAFTSSSKADKPTRTASGEKLQDDGIDDAILLAVKGACVGSQFLSTALILTAPTITTITPIKTQSKPSTKSTELLQIAMSSLRWGAIV